MDWILFDAMYPFLGWQFPADTPRFPGSAPTETDLWITAGMYEFVAMRSVCEKCGAKLGRKLNVSIFPGTTWLISVGARCRGWRRHRHVALVAERQGGLHFGELRPS